MARGHRLPKSALHRAFWDASLPPALEIDPGDTVHFEVPDVSDGQRVELGGTGRTDPSRSYPLAGPVYVRGAEPGDALRVEILDLKPLGTGWTGFFPGRGLLGDDFTEPYVRYFDLSGTHARLGDHDVWIPIQPFCGTMGVAPAEAGRHPIAPPGPGAGNVDVRHLVAGSTLWLPVLVPGALFSAGDCHAAQGDGEVCITGIECPMAVSLRFDVERGTGPRPWSFRYRTPQGSPQPLSDPAGYLATAATGPDLMENCRNAVRDMIAWLVAEKGLSREDAYVLCSLAGDLRVSEVVDAPNWVVSFQLSLAVFRNPSTFWG